MNNTSEETAAHDDGTQRELLGSYVSTMSMIWVTIIFYILIIGILICCAAALVFTRWLYKRRAKRKLDAEKEKHRRLEDRLIDDERKVKDKLRELRERELELRLQQQNVQFKVDTGPKEAKTVYLPSQPTQAAPPVNVYLPPQPYVYPAPVQPQVEPPKASPSRRKENNEEKAPIWVQQNVHWPEELVKKMEKEEISPKRPQPKSTTSSESQTDTPTTPPAPSRTSSVMSTTPITSTSLPPKQPTLASNDYDSTTTVSMSTVVSKPIDSPKAKPSKTKDKPKNVAKSKPKEHKKPTPRPREQVAVQVGDVGGVVDRLAAGRVTVDGRPANAKVELVAGDSSDQSTLRQIASIPSMTMTSTSLTNPTAETTTTTNEPKNGGSVDTLDDPRFKATLYHIPPEENPILSANPYWRSQSNRKMEIDRKKSPTTGKVRQITVKSKEDTTWFPPADYDRFNWKGKSGKEHEDYPMYATVHHKPPSTSTSTVSKSKESASVVPHRYGSAELPWKHKAARVNLL